MIELSELRYGPGARDRRRAASAPGLDGARAALETFYFAFNNRDSELMAEVWSAHPLAQLHNPVGGNVRGGKAIADLYARIFSAPARVIVELGDIVEYGGEEHVVFAGVETGTYSLPTGEQAPLSIRTSRYFRFEAESGRWRQFHHHGSIDHPDALRGYQSAIVSQRRGFSTVSV